jgi:hypothetical protein
VVPQHYVATTFSAAPTAIQLPRAARSKERPLSRQNLVDLIVSSLPVRGPTKSGRTQVLKPKSNVRKDITGYQLPGFQWCQLSPQVTGVRRLTLRPGARRSPVGQRLAGLAIDRLFSPADASVKGIRRFGADRRRIKRKKSYAASRHAGYCPADSSSSSTATYLTVVLIIYSLPVLHGVPFLLVLATRSVRRS